MSEIRALGNGRYLVSNGTRQRPAYAVAAGNARWVFLDGRTYVVEAGGRGQAAGSTGQRHQNDDLALASPMPATVSSIRVTAGQPVAAGDVLIMLEAMKMELPIKAPRDGMVKAVRCREGELVQPGVALLELE